MPTINVQQVMNKLTAPNRSYQNLAYSNVKKRVDSVKRQTLGNLQQHIVSQELDAGPFGTNPSGALQGRSGNLFAFLGFPAGYDPVGSLYDILNRELGLKSSPPSISREANRLIYTFRATAPTMREIYALTKHPAASEFGNVSWVKAIEEGYDNLRYYLYKSGLEKWSRSGAAIQSKSTVRPTPQSSKAVPYVSEILQGFVSKLKR